MKTENTMSNKAKFFAQYWNQRVWSRTHTNGEKVKLYINEDTLQAKKGNYINDFLELTPLSQITDEDAKHLRYNDSISATKTYINSIGRTTEEADYLRSKAYALPWMHLSVEYLVEYGWIKLKTN